jgi:Auxin responsive protein
MMLNPIRPVEIPRKSLNKTKSNMPASPKGHFAAYTRDAQRFLVPISYLGSEIFEYLLKLCIQIVFGPMGHFYFYLIYVIDRKMNK